MNRRRYLAVTASLPLLAGCSGSADATDEETTSEPSEDTRDATETPTTTPTETSSDFETTRLTLGRDAVRPGAEVVVSVSVRNVGDAAGTFHARAEAGGNSTTDSVDIEPGETVTLELPLMLSTTGDTTVYLNRKVVGTVTVAEPTFDRLDSEVTPDTVIAGDAVTVSARVVNRAEIPGTYTGRVEIGPASATREVELDAGESTRIEFSLTPTTAGEFTATLDGIEVGTLTVESLGTYHVAPDGDDANLGAQDSPLASVHEGLKRARPGDTVQVAAGEYREGEVEGKPVETVRAGDPDAPITVTGPPDAVLRPSVRIGHSHVHLTGLSIEGLHDPENPDDPAAYPELSSPDVYPVSVRPPEDSDTYLRGVVCAPHRIGPGAIALVRVMRTVGIEIGPMEIAGMAGASWILSETPNRHAGEIIYLGAPAGIIYEDFYPWEGLDLTRDVYIHHVDNSAGHPHSELVDVKQGTSDVLIEYCTDAGGAQQNEDYYGASVGLRSHDATVRWCDLRNGDGHAVKITNFVDWLCEHPEAALDPDEYAGNAVYGNRMSGYGATAVDVHTTLDEQRSICGNDIPEPSDPSFTDPCPEAVPDGEGIGHTGGDPSRT